MGKVRNVRVWYLRPQDGRREEVAGFWQHGTTPISTFITWLGICIQVHNSRSDIEPMDIGDPRWGLYPVTSREDLNNPYKTLSSYPLQDLKYSANVPLGDYLILRRNDMSPLYCTPSEFPYMERTLALEDAASSLCSPSSSESRVPTFAKRLRDRDRGCCITGRSIEDMGDDIEAFMPVHIFPRSHLDSWEKDQLQGIIQDDGPSQGTSSIDSIQNGLLLALTERVLFSKNHITVDVDAGHAIVDFTSSGAYHGRSLKVNKYVDARYKPLDDLLRFHYLQSVLCNVRGPGKASSTPAAMTPRTSQRTFSSKRSDPALHLRAAGLEIQTSPRTPLGPAPPLPLPPRRASASNAFNASTAPATPAGSGPPSRSGSPTTPDRKTRLQPPPRRSPHYSPNSPSLSSPPPPPPQASAAEYANRPLPPVLPSVNPRRQHEPSRRLTPISSSPPPTSPPPPSQRSSGGRAAFDNPKRELQGLGLGRTATGVPLASPLALNSFI